MKKSLKKEAIGLRKKGLSYSEILKQIPVAKSTLSLWLRSIGLSKRQTQRLTKKKLAAIKRGLVIWKQMRVDRTKKIINEAIQEINKISRSTNQLKLMGTMLYWAEGAKTKEYRPSQNISFSNSDPKMIRFFLLWLQNILNISSERIKFNIYLHETHKLRINEIKKYWSGVTGYYESKFDKIYFKRNKIGTKRRNVNDNYHGLIRILVRKSTNLNRKITGWTLGICNQWGVV